MMIEMIFVRCFSDLLLFVSYIVHLAVDRSLHHQVLLQAQLWQCTGLDSVGQNM